MIARRVSFVVLLIFLSGCATTKVYNLNKAGVPANDPNGLPSVNQKWEDFDKLLTEYYLPLNWDCNKYISNRHLVIFKASEQNQEKFRFFFKQYWGKEIVPEEVSNTSE